MANARFAELLEFNQQRLDETQAFALRFIADTSVSILGISLFVGGSLVHDQFPGLAETGKALIGTGAFDGMINIGGGFIRNIF